jgi:RNA polymerase sigma-70 factor (ECF subfamily)
MAANTGRTSQIKLCLDRLRGGDDEARRELLEIAYERLRLLTGRITRDYPAVRRDRGPSDIHQDAMLRLYQALRDVSIRDAEHFLRLAALEIRRECLDILRRNEVQPKRIEDVPEPGGSTDNPEKLARWTELHEYIQALPEDERRYFDLLFYNGLTQQEAADLLRIPLITLRRAWMTTRRKLVKHFGDWNPLAPPHPEAG